MSEPRATRALAQSPNRSVERDRTDAGPHDGVPPTGRMRFDGIEVGRGIAACLVVLHHSGEIIAEPRFYDALIWGGLLKNFNVGIDFFFVLSGFIIAWVHWGDVGRPERVVHYARRRFLRIYPPYWGVMLPLAALYFIFPAAGKSHQHDVWGFVFSVLLLPYPDGPILGAAWTLVHEVIFYGVFALLIARGGIAAWLLPAWALAIVAAQPFVPLPFPLSLIFNAFNLEFLFGVAAALWLRDRKVPFPRVFALAGLAAFLGFMLFAPTIQGVSIVGRLAFGLSATVGILGIVEWERSRGLHVAKPLLALGAASYAVYLIHGVTLSATIHVLTKLGFRAAPLPLVVLILVAASVIAGLLYHAWVERPLSLWFKAPRLPFRRASPSRAAVVLPSEPRS